MDNMENQTPESPSSDQSGASQPQTPPANSHRPAEDSKEWKLIEKVLTGMQSEQKRARRWGIFFKSLTFIYLFALLWMIRLPGEDAQLSRPDSYAAVIEVNGVIAADEDASADRIITALRDAFEDESYAPVRTNNLPSHANVVKFHVYIFRSNMFTDDFTFLFCLRMLAHRLPTSQAVLALEILGNKLKINKIRKKFFIINYISKI